MLQARHAVPSFLALIALGAPAAQARDLTFEDRVQAQEAIERLYYSHQIGATRPFEEAVPRAALEAKVRKYLKQSVALERLWNTRLSADMLQAEMQRQARETRMPDRLLALYAALGNDPLLVQECLARPVLVDRLTRSFFAFDGRIHAEARQEVEELHQGLVRHGIEAFAGHPARGDVEIEEIADGPGVVARGPEGEFESARMELRPEEFARWRREAPERSGAIGSVREQRDAFVVSVIVEERASWARVVNFIVPKRSWDDWWRDVSNEIDERSVTPALGPSPLPVPVPASMGISSSTSSSCLPDDTWGSGPFSGTPIIPEPRVGHTAVWTGSLMVVWGGHGSNNGLDTGGRYDPATDTWTPTSTVGAPSPRAFHTAVWTGRLMVVWGGYGLDTGGRYDPTSDTWTPTSTVGAPSPRDGNTTVWTGSLMVVWGGQSRSTFLYTGARYDPETDTWTPTSIDERTPSGRAGHTAVWTGSLMVVWGGEAEYNQWLRTGGRYDPATDSWTETSFVAIPRARHTAVWTGSLMVVWGPYDGSGARYDPATDRWTAMSANGAPAGRVYHRAIWTGSAMLVWGGWYNSAMGTGSRYDPVTDTWTPTSTAGAPSPRYWHTAVWTGSLMVVWGGAGDSGALYTGGRYDPATDTWTAMSPVARPSGRQNATAVWTGSVLLVWGGWDGAFLNTGARYDPITETWTETSTAGAPSGRVYHTAVWTGDLMLVWGGLQCAGISCTALATGGRYDPMTDTWAPISTTGAPSVAHHTAVWTGRLMVVWLGGRYDPATDTWMPTSTIGAPSASYGHSAVWTGDVMVVWGGCCGDGGIPEYLPVLGTGGRYDPESDTWTATSSAGAPGPRLGHTAVWTGDLMLVWGGYGSGLYSWTNSGGRYDPATDTWTETSTAWAPSPRNAHTAVWTGSLMVVWGGLPGFGYGGLHTGGRYDPASDTWAPTSTTGAPSPRHAHTAVWTGSLMVILGGSSDNTIGQYALGHTADDDEDGFSECDGDCNDGSPATYPGAAEVCDGLDNDCDGLTDEDTLPSISVVVTPGVLWPPNHRMVPVHATIAVDACPTSGPAPGVALIAVTSSEPDEAVGGSDGGTVNDIQNADVGGADFDLELRAERDETGGGRAYSLTYAVTDANGHVVSAVGHVFVPSNQDSQRNRSPARR